MAPTPGATELFGIPGVGRTFASMRPVRLGDVDTAGMLRLDATARYLQDVATDDARDAGLDGRFGWVVRRTMMDIHVVPQLDEVMTITTYCTGFGRSWAERSTCIEGENGGSIRTVSVWVQVDTTTGRPTALTPQFLEIYGEACDGRKVSARLSLAAPPAGCTSRPWPVRRVDLDPFDHVNNAANWAFVEEAADFARTGRPRAGLAEMEFAAPIEASDGIELRTAPSSRSAPSAPSAGSPFDMWLVAGGAVLSAARLTSR